MAQTTAPAEDAYDYSLKRVIFASSAGTMIEWYDFYIFGTLAVILSDLFYPEKLSGGVKLLAVLATFATGFVVRPFGAAFFGRIGDITGRKFTFLVTISIMGGATFAIGLLPTYDTLAKLGVGFLAPLVLVLLRLLQGLALGGEYGGAAIYVAEHAPDRRRGYFTSYIQTTATLGLLLSLIVLVSVRLTVGEAAFKTWGWRIPFLLSGALVAIALYIRASLKETPLFRALKASGKTSRAPLRDSCKNGAWKLMALALFGATAGQGVVWYTGQFYALFFLQNVLKVSLVQSSVIVGIVLVLATPFFLVFGSLSDRIGRKPIMLAGCALAAVTYLPLYRAMTAAACGAPPTGGFTTNFVCSPASPVALGALIFMQVIYVTMVYGPIAAFLVELFPGRVRYTSLSLPYHIGNGVFGGLVPFVATAIVARTGNIYAGLAYPIAVAVMTFFVGLLLLRETSTNRIYEEVGVAPVPAGSSQ
ncbi:MAG: MFS transporter [Egibacteraceae bacterium]